MVGDVAYTDGVTITLGDGTEVVADGRDPDGDINFLSHAHGDHLYYNSPGSIICTELTAALAEARRDEVESPEITNHPLVTMIDAGHIAGSTAAVIEDEANGLTYLYTGDICTRSRFYLSGFDPPPADVLITEATYGQPNYRFPPKEHCHQVVVDWLDETRDRPVFMFGYSLGRAQKLQLLVNQADRHRLFVTDAIERVNEPIADWFDIEFETRRFSQDVELEAGDVVVLPTQLAGSEWVEDIVTEYDAVKAGFSGWAVDTGFKYRGDYDTTFILSDHCDFSELLSVVEQVAPEQVYTVYGFTDELANFIETETGYNAQSLKRNQSSLSDF